MTKWVDPGRLSLGPFVLLFLVSLLTRLTISFPRGGGKRKFQIQGWSSTTTIHPRVATKAFLPLNGPTTTVHGCSHLPGTFGSLHPAVSSQFPGSFPHITKLLAWGLLQAQAYKVVEIKGWVIKAIYNHLYSSLYHISVLNASSRHSKHVLPGQNKMLCTPNLSHDWAIPASRH